MIEQLYQNLKTAENPRKELIALKEKLKEEDASKELQELLQGDYGVFLECLHHEDAKVRKNAALILGQLKENKNAKALYEAYKVEVQRFVRTGYLTALRELDYEEFLPKLKERQKELEAYQPKENEKKHVREELTAIRKMTGITEIHSRLGFKGYKERYDVILTTGKMHQEVTSRQITQGVIRCLKGGVMVKGGNVRELEKIRTFRELLFLLDIRKIPGEPAQAAEALAASNLTEFLKRAHGSFKTCRFRLGIQGKMPLDKRSSFAKRCAFDIEKQTKGQLMNSTSDYEIELRLMENGDGTFLPLVKLYTLKDMRFAYRKHTVASSIRPEQAAVIAALGQPYMKEEAQILDPFCGVGTMLLERDRICPARVMYGIDLYGQAIIEARKNTEAAEREIYYINRDFFDFTHEYLFDEIITNMPEKGQKTKEEQDRLYGKFFQKAGEILKNKGIILMYSNEKGFVKKQLRIREGFTLLQEYSMDEKGICYLFIIEKRG